ncbi:farnesyl-diphosphate synthase [Bryocella elongata]|uniref:Farnesyl-diphosphate synthase n=1 Tax=Bryocella elongata TaxID=863522 RepID=A0A1H5WR53_9BACT|nr:farnesyl diphosphate synthase [Bryocella elongata]SEG01803.1 farnesyl-diphosphate synthase [Bryocella elongata]
MNVDVQQILKNGVVVTDAALERLLPSANTLPHSIHRAMRHSTFAGGKRLRPILAMEAAKMVAGREVPGADELGAALEMVHTYSLIHDDLPALDNDDLRRGMPTCHVAFGEAIAILAGDALQTLAFQTLSQIAAQPATLIDIIREFSFAIGTGVGMDTGLPSGMIGGQVMDIEGEGQKPTAELVERIHRAKTGALITTSIVCGGILGLGDLLAQPDSSATLAASPKDVIAALRSFGENAGLAFQIVDDILDVTQSSEQLGKTAGKDTASDKATWPAVYGLEQSEKDAASYIADAFAALEPYGQSAAPLKALAQYLVERKH